MRRRRSTKTAKHLMCHAKKRASQRYGLYLSDEDLDSIVNQIQTGRAEFIAKQSNRVTLFKVRYLRKDYPVVYDRTRKSIVSFLPEGAFD